MSFTLIESFGALFGITGTLFLARKGPLAGYGFVAFLLSNFAWIWFALDRELYPFLVQQIVFTASSLYGVWVWLIRPKLQPSNGTPTE